MRSLLFFAVVCLAVVEGFSTPSNKHVDVLASPMPVSLGEIMAKIQLGAPKDEIIALVENLQRKVEGDAATAAFEHESYQGGFCSLSDFEDTIRTGKEQNTTLTVEMKDLVDANNNIRVECMPAGEDNITKLEAEIQALHEQLAKNQADREAENLEYERKKAEILQALQIIREIRIFIQNSTLDNRANLAMMLFEKSQTARAKTKAQLVDELEKKATASTGLAQHLMLTAAKALKRGDGMDGIYELLYTMRNEFTSSLAAETSMEKDRYDTFFEKSIGIAQEISAKQAGIQDAKEAMTECMRQFAVNDQTSAQKSQERTTIIGNVMLAQIELADQQKRCADEAVHYEESTARRNKELASLEELLNQLRAIDFPAYLNDINVTAATTTASSECYCDALCQQEGDCCESCDFQWNQGTDAPDSGATDAPGL